MTGQSNLPVQIGKPDNVVTRAHLLAHLVSALLVSVLVVSSLGTLAEGAEEPVEADPEPVLHGLFPLGGQRGSSFLIEVRGEALTGAYAAVITANDRTDPDSFSTSDGLVAQVLSIASSQDRVQLQVTIAGQARIGPHALWLVTPLGLSNAVYFHVHAEPVIDEAPPATKQRDRLSQAQIVSTPVVVNGVIARQGERDFYAFDVQEGQQLSFEVILSRESLQNNFRPQMKLHDPTGSWFDPHQLTRLAFHSEVIQGQTPITSLFSYQFPQAGRYLLELGSERHKGTPEYAYQLRIVPPAQQYRRYGARVPSVARLLARPLTNDRVALLWSRTVASDSLSQAEHPPLAARAEQEPNDQADQAMPLTVPSLIEGTISHPGDRDRFTFTLEDDQRLAFEIETFDAVPPHFNPRLEITDKGGRTLLTNVLRMNMVKNERWDLQRPVPKIIQTFEQGGTYTLEVRDVTSRAGRPDFRYRLLIRRQIPHVGEVKITTLKRSFEDKRIDPFRINLKPGEAKTLMVETPIEEISADVVEPRGTRKFIDGAAELALLVENLPPGVRAYSGNFIENTRAEDKQPAQAYNLLPDIQKATLVLHADQDAPTMRMPQAIRVIAQTLIQDRPGVRIVAGQLPLMISSGNLPSTAEPSVSTPELSAATGAPVPSEPETTTEPVEPAEPAEPIAADAAEVVASEAVATAAAGQDNPDSRPDSAGVARQAAISGVGSVSSGNLATEPGDTVGSLRLVPPSLHLQGKGATGRVLVLAQYVDGLERDVTAQSRLVLSSAGVAELAPGSRINALANGEVQLTATFASQTASAPVVVQKHSQVRPFRFSRDVVGILTKRGCNNVECHGSVKGKGGFKLSAGGMFPRQDYRWIVEGGTYHVMAQENEEASPNSRLNLDDPQQSLLLLKATNTQPHGGEQRLAHDDADYQALRRWIQKGAAYDADDLPAGTLIQSIKVYPKEAVLEPAARHRLVVMARLADGTNEDITDQVHYESNNLEVMEVTAAGSIKAKHSGEADVIVRAAGHATSARVGVVARLSPSFAEQPAHNFIDEHIFAKLRRFQILPSPTSTDAEFLRRACLDVTGTLPPPHRVREFLANQAADKRDQLIDILLESPEYVEFWTYRFSELFRVYSGATLNAEHARLHENWIHNNIARNKPYDQVARERIAAQGYNSPAWHYWTFRQLTPPTEVATEQFRVFAGRRLGCAQCHNHPFENWSQDQFWGFAAFFGNMTRLAAIDGMRGPYFVIDDPAGHGFRKVGRGRLIHPRSKEQVEPTFLDGQQLPAAQQLDPRLQLANWMTSPENPYFAETIVNRIWSYYLGRGIVDPVDDFRTVNPPSHPQLLAALSADFIENGYDLKHLMRTILRSRTYQLAGVPNDSNQHDQLNYSHARPRFLEPPVLLDAISQVTLTDSELVATGQEDATSGVPAGMRAINVLPNDVPCPFFDAYNRNDRRGVPEDTPQLSMVRSLHRLVGPTFTKGFIGQGGRLDKLLGNNLSDAQIIEELYLAAFSRFPTPQEQQQVERLLDQQPSREEGLESFTWALLNAREFVYNH